MSEFEVEPQSLSEADSLSSYIPQYLRGYLTSRKGSKHEDSRPPAEKAKSVLFDTLSIPDASVITTLNVVYEKGFVIWALPSSSVILPLICNRSVVIDRIRLLKCEARKLKKAHENGSLPAAVQVCNLMNGTFEVSRLNISSGEYDKRVSFEGFCWDVLTSEGFVALATETSIHILSSNSFQKLFAIDVRKRVALSHPYALSTVLLACSTSFAPEARTDSASGDSLSNWMQGFATSAVDFAKKGSSQLWEYGMRQIAPIDDGESDANEAYGKGKRKIDETTRDGVNTTKEDLTAAGNVFIQDMLSRRVVAHFFAHRHEIGTIEFDPSGMFLFTSSIEGHVVNVVRIHFNNREPPTLVFRMRRGYSDALIRTLKISQGNEFATVISESGTSHVFQLHDFVAEAPKLAKSNNAQEESTSIKTISSLERLKRQDSSEGIEAADLKNDFAGSGVLAVTIDEHRLPPWPLHILVANEEATLKQYTIHRGKEKHNAQIKPFQSWNLARRPSWGETRGNIKSFFSETAKSTHNTWFEDYDVILSGEFRSLWRSYQFSFYSISEDKDSESYDEIFGPAPQVFSSLERVEIRKFDPIPSLVLPTKKSDDIEPSAPAIDDY